VESLYFRAVNSSHSGKPFSELLCVFMGSELAASGPANNTAAAVTVSRSYSHLASGFHSGHRTPVLGEVFSLWQLITAEHAAKWDY
jgi:hypothetical protein